MSRQTPQPLPGLPRRRDGLIGASALIVLAVLGWLWPMGGSSPGPYSDPVVSHLTGPDLRLDAVGDVEVEIRPPWAEPTADLVGRVALYDRPGARPLPIVDMAWERLSTRRDSAYRLVDPAAADDVEPADEASTASLVERVRDARVAIQTPSGPRVCDQWRFDRWFCGPDPWVYVGVTEITVRDRPWTCLWAHPTAEGPLELIFDDLPAGASLRGRYAFNDAAADRGSGDGVRLEALTGDTSLLETVAPMDRGHRSWRVELPEDATSVTLRVTATELAQRHFCLDASVRAPVGPRTTRPSLRIPDPTPDASGATTPDPATEGSGADVPAAGAADEGSGTSAGTGVLDSASASDGSGDDARPVQPLRPLLQRPNGLTRPGRPALAPNVLTPPGTPPASPEPDP